VIAAAGVVDGLGLGNNTMAADHQGWRKHTPAVMMGASQDAGRLAGWVIWSDL
jgi:hypothetical protein